MTVTDDGKATTTSLKVAKRFMMVHDDVVVAIDKLVEEGIAGFTEMALEDPITEQTIKAYEMDRDGFMILIMGFQCDEALMFRMDFVEAFNVMEQEIMRFYDSVETPELPHLYEMEHTL